MVLLLVAPVATITPINQTVVSPDNAIFNCSATAKPRAEIQWMRNGMVLDNTVDNFTNVTEFMQGNCSITSLPSECVLISTLNLTDTIPANTGDYMCNASNPAGSDMETASLTIHGL